MATEAQSTTDEYEAIAPQMNRISFASNFVEIPPLKVGQLPAFARVLKGINIAPILDFEESQDFSGILDMIADHGDAIIKACSIASGIEEEAIKDANIVDLAELVTAVYRVNRDFFVKALPQMMQRVSTPPATNGTGPTPSAHS